VIITSVYEEGHLIGFAKVTRDLSERRRADEDRRVATVNDETFKLLVSSVKDYAIFMLSPTGQIQTWNEGAQRIKGYTAAEIIGKSFSTFYTEDAKAAQHPQHELKIARKEGRYEEEGWRVRKDGTTFWANVVITAVYDRDKLIGFGKVTRDLTEFKVADDRRKLAEHELEKHAQQLEETNEELQRLAYVVSHELQAPISTIGRYGNLLTARYKDKLGDDATEFIGKINDSTRLIARMVDDLWTYARISKSNQSLELVYVTIALKEAMGQLQDDLADEELTYSDLPTVTGNKQQFVFLFKELLQNAVRYRNPAVRPAIHVQAEQADGGWRFSVKDNGIGIDPIYSNEAFRLFHRLKGGPTAEATGMGLAICKKIVQHYSGRIWFESHPEGTTFYFWIPEKQSTRPD
jgi:PAS domain S-box-containing protein